MERYTPEFKAKVVMEAMSSRATDTSVAQEYGVHPVTLSRWKAQLTRNAAAAFREGAEDPQGRAARVALSERVAALERELEIVRALCERGVDIDAKVEAVHAHKEELGLNRACELVGLPKSTYYYRLG